MTHKLRIYKYLLGNGYEDKIEIPKDSSIIDAQKQGRNIVVYAEVDPNEEETETHTFYQVTTGSPIPKYGYHLKTLMFNNDTYVLHIYHQQP